MLKNSLKSHRLPNKQYGQAMLEYTVAFTLVTFLLIVPYDGERLYVRVVYELEQLNLNLLAGLSLYAYPL